VMDLVKQYSVSAVGPTSIFTKTSCELRLPRALAAAAKHLTRREISRKVNGNQDTAAKS
jgi:hypothetical protein